MEELNEPAAHGWHERAPRDGLLLPRGHGVHMVLPRPRENVPTGQISQAPSVLLKKEPAEHQTHWLSPSVRVYPSGHEKEQAPVGPAMTFTSHSTHLFPICCVNGGQRTHLAEKAEGCCTPNAHGCRVYM